MQLLMEYHDSVWKQSRKKLKEYLVYQEQDSLHDFRKSIRQLNTLFNLFHFVDAGFQSESYLRRTNKMYEHAGELRDEFVSQSLAKKYGFALQINEELKLIQFEKLKRHYIGNNSHNSNAKQKGRMLLAEITSEDLKRFSHFVVSNLTTEIANAENFRDVHQIRKDIKQYLLLNKFLELEKIETAKSADLDFLDSLQNSIGNKHDIEKFLRKIGDRKLTEKMETTITKIEKDEKKINNEISVALKTWSKKHEHES